RQGGDGAVEREEGGGGKGEAGVGEGQQGQARGPEEPATGGDGTIRGAAEAVDAVAGRGVRRRVADRVGRVQRGRAGGGVPRERLRQRVGQGERRADRR